MDQRFTADMIIGAPLALKEHIYAERILSQTMAWEESLFYTVSDAMTDDYHVDVWVARLSYLAMHYHQHRHAISEAELRLKNADSCSKALQERGIQPFDFECPNSKFLLTPLSEFGLGINVRSNIALALWLGLIMDRTVMFYSNITEFVVSKKEQAKRGGAGPWLKWSLPLFSCECGDFQCVFLPQSPCVLTKSDILNATHWSALYKDVAARVQIPNSVKNPKVVSLKSRPVTTPRLAMRGRKTLAGYARMLADAMTRHDPRRPVVDMAIARMIKEPPPDGLFPVFALRPLPAIRDRVRRDVASYRHGHVSSTSAILGLPIRGSDKCRRESNCLSFSQYMEAVNTTWPTLGNATILLTTESTKVVAEYENFTRSSSQPQSYTFIRNEKDVLPDTGDIYKLGKGRQISADEALIAALTSLQLQMLAQASLFNCCSNFHLLIRDMLALGLGSSRHTAVCMDAMKDPRLRICCQWTPECQSRRELELVNLTHTL